MHPSTAAAEAVAVASETVAFAMAAAELDSVLESCILAKTGCCCHIGWLVGLAAAEIDGREEIVASVARAVVGTASSLQYGPCAGHCWVRAPMDLSVAHAAVRWQTLLAGRDEGGVFDSEDQT